MGNRWLAAVILVSLALVVSAAAPWQQQALEYKFVRIGSWTTNAQGERVSFTEKAASMATDLSGEGWTLVSSSAAGTEDGSFLVLTFSRPKQ